MIAKKRKSSSRIVLCAGLALSLASLAQAQPIFQSTFPGHGGNDAAKGGVLLTKDGGTISVGESQTLSSSGTYDAYVVKTDECGFLQWSATYDFGGSDFGRKIRATDDGGYIIVGTTDRTTCCDEKSSSADIFLLKIDEKGNVDWAKTYGGAGYDEGTDVQLHPFGGYTVTGNTQSFGDGKINGYLQRTDDNGNILWGRSYGVRDGADFFNGCTVTAKGDILVVGTTHSFGGTHILTVRTDPDGYISPSGWATFYPSEGPGNGRSIIETSDGTFVIAGGLVTTQSGTLDGYLLRIDGTNGTALFDQAFAEANGKYSDELAEVRETFDGHLIFTGYMTDAPGGFAGRDLLLGEVDYKFNPQWYSLHGGKLDDEGYSLAFSAELSKERGEIFVAANGVTWNFTKKGGEELYLIQALRGGKSGCNDTYPKVKDFRPELQGKQVDYCHPLVRVQCFAKVGAEYHKDQNLLCTSCKFDGLQQENGGDPNLGQVDHDIQQNGLRNGATRVETTQVKGRTEMVRGTR